MAKARAEAPSEKELFSAVAMGNMDRVKCLIGLGADVNARGKDQSNCLHYASRTNNPDLVEYLVRQGLHVNCKDVNDVTPLMIAGGKGNMDTVKCLIGLGADVNARDRNQRNCLHFAALSNNPADLVEYLVSQGLDVSCLADNKSALLVSLYIKEDEIVSVFTHFMKEHTILHSSCELDPDESNPLIICATTGYTFGARSILDAGVVDINTSLKHSSLQRSCSNGHTDITRLLLLTEEYELSDIRENIFNISPISSKIDYPSILLDGPQTTTLESLICMPGVGSVLALPDTYASIVHQAVFKFLHHVSKNMKNLYSDAELVRCGSVGEGAKVGLPNEMDILFPVEYNKKCSYVAATQIRSDFVQFSAPGDFAQGSILFHETFYDQWSQAFDSCPETDSVSKIDLGKGVGSIKKMNRKACTPLLLLYHDKAETICVSVDMVPCVYINNWLDDFLSKTWLMDHSELKEKGYIIVPKPPHRKSKIADQFTEQQMEELWRISFSHLETEHIKMLEDRILNVYVAVKCLRNPDVCRIMITEGEGLPKNVDDYISSYMLKSMFLKNVEDFLRPDHRQSLKEMVCKVYDDLDDALHEGFIPTFFMPTVNVLDGLKVDEGKSAKVARIMKTFVRRFCSGDTIEEDVQGKYNVFNIMTDQWTTVTLKLKRPIEEFTVYKRTWPYYQRE